MAYLDYVRAENVIKEFYYKLLDYTTDEIFTKTRKAVSALETAPVRQCSVGKDILRGKMITVATLYDRHLPNVVRNGIEWRVRKESWIALYSDKVWTGLITGSQDVYCASNQEDVIENLQYSFTTDRDIDGVLSLKH